VDQTSKGPCSPNIIGGSNTVNCGPPSHWYDLNGDEHSVVGSDTEYGVGIHAGAVVEMQHLLAAKKWSALRDAAEKQIDLTPEWPGPYLEASYAYARLCQKDRAMKALQTFIDKATVFSRSSATYGDALQEARSNLAALKSGQGPKCN